MLNGHRKQLFVVGAIALAIALAGCNSPGSKQDPPAQYVNYRNVDGTPQTVLLVGGAGLVTGIVQDPDGHPLGPAHVALLGTDQSFVTGPDGIFQFLNLGKGTFTLRVDADGYRSAEAPLSVKAGSVTEARVKLVPLPPAGEATLTPQTTAVGMPYARELALGTFLLGCVFMVLLGWWLRGHPSRLLRRAEANLKGGQLAQAERLVRRVLRRNPDDSAAWFLLGSVLIKRSEYRQAIRELEAAAAKQDPGLAGLAFLITLAHNRLGQPDQARRWLPLVARDLDYWNALRQDPDHMLVPSTPRRVQPTVHSDPAYG